MGGRPYWQHSYAWLAAVRNVLAERALAHGADLFSVDSDVLAPPDALRRLDLLALPIAAAVISNSKGRGVDEHATSLNFRPFEDGQHQAALRAGKARLRKVDYTGACCLYRRAVQAAGVRWGFDREGEDVAFCRAARAAGFRSYVDGRVRAEHRMLRPGAQVDV